MKDLYLNSKVKYSIQLIRNQKVILDTDLAELYQVQTKVLVQSVKRNIGRFPSDFMFQLSDIEFENLRSQLVTSNQGGRRHRPYAFTEQGVAMLSGVLRSERAILVNIQIMRAFVSLRSMVSSDENFEKRIFELEKKYNHQFKIVFDAIRGLIKTTREESIKRPIGFNRKD